MIDLHCHILPQVDDGSGNLGDSLEMGALAAANGTRHIITTPHCNIPGCPPNYRSASLSQTLQTLQAAFRERHIPITLYPGQEIFLTGPIEQRFRQGQFMTLNNSRYALVEFQFSQWFPDAMRKLEAVKSQGIIPILAHPERYGFLMEYHEAAQTLREAGVLLQINWASVHGFFGREQMHAARYMLRHRLADFVASDAHNQYCRTPDLSGAHEWICENLSSDYAEFLLNVNPGRVIQNQTVTHY